MNFDEFDLCDNLVRGLKDAGYVTCTAVQKASLEASIVNKRDIYAQSQTGTGKTAAFLVPLLSFLSSHPSEGKNGRFGLILAPTRELVAQVEKESRLLGKYLSLKVAQVVGGVDYSGQQRNLAQNPDLIVATPGRLTDFVKRGILDLKRVKYLVIDEADRMFDMGFQNDILDLIRQMPSPKERRTFLFSATLNAKVGRLVWEHMVDPVTIAIEPEKVAVPAIEQAIYHVARNEKVPLLLALIQKFKPRSVIIFSNTKVGAVRIADFFKKLNMNCGIIEGNMPQNKRTRVINDLVAGRISFLAATDVISRGLHVPELEWVINFDLPNEPENYVHRIGRTARAGCTGKAISFACERYVFNLSSIEKLIGNKITVAWPDKDLQDLMTDFNNQLRFFNPRNSGSEVEIRKGRDDTYGSNSQNRNHSSSGYGSNSQNRNHSSPGYGSNSRNRNHSSPGSDRYSDGGGGGFGKRSPRRTTSFIPSSSSRVGDYDGAKVSSRSSVEELHVGKGFDESYTGERFHGSSVSSCGHSAESNPIFRKKNFLQTETDRERPQRVQLKNIDDRIAYYSQKYGDQFQSSRPLSKKVQSGLKFHSSKKIGLETSPKRFEKEGDLKRGGVLKKLRNFFGSPK